MESVFLLLVSFLAIGIFARSYTLRIRVVLSMAIIVMLLYLYMYK
jgi:hypothetical protein